MTKNDGLVDRMIRLIVGGLLLGWAALYPEVSYSSFGWIGIVIAATGFFVWCGLYSLVGFSTKS